MRKFIFMAAMLFAVSFPAMAEGNNNKEIIKERVEL